MISGKDGKFMRKIWCFVLAALLLFQPCSASAQTAALNEDTQEKIVDFMDLLAYVDAGENDMYFSENKEIDTAFLNRFLTWSIWCSIPFIDGNAAEVTELSSGLSGWKIPEEKLKMYLQNSVGRSDYEMNGNMSLADGTLEIGGFTPSACYGHERPEVQNVSRISDTDIQAEGTVSYMPEFSEQQPYTASFCVVLTKNEASMWGGYTLKEIRTWEKTDTTSSAGDGMQTDTAGGYTDEELCQMARTYCESRNFGISPQYVTVDNTNGNMVMIHLYEDMGDHTATYDWYTVDRNTAVGTNILGETVDLTNP